jgi:hypothetical protein
MIMMGCKGFKTRAASSANQENADFFRHCLCLSGHKNFIAARKRCNVTRPANLPQMEP